MIRVGVVDDSATMRGIIIQALRMDSTLDVVGEASDPMQARSMIKAVSPDVITLDIEMPGMDGLDFLERIMRLRPMPVVMVSTLTSRGAEANLRALALGAVDCVGKPGLTGGGDFLRLAEVVRAAANARINRPSATHQSAVQPAPFRSNGRLLALGASTGGVEALMTVVSAFPANCPPTVITQHMPGTFTASFAKRLDRHSAARVTEAANGAPLEPGHVYLAPGGEAHLEVTGHGRRRCRLSNDGPINGHRPSVDALFESVAKSAGSRALGVILTGMGQDGARGLLAMRQAGARTLGQDEASCVIYGMPRTASNLGAVERQVPLEALSAEILSLCNAHPKERR